MKDYTTYTRTTLGETMIKICDALVVVCFGFGCFVIGQLLGLIILIK